MVIQKFLLIYHFLMIHLTKYSSFYLFWSQNIQQLRSNWWRVTLGFPKWKESAYSMRLVLLDPFSIRSLLWPCSPAWDRKVHHDPPRPPGYLPIEKGILRSHGCPSWAHIPRSGNDSTTRSRNGSVPSASRSQRKQIPHWHQQQDWEQPGKHTGT